MVPLQTRRHLLLTLRQQTSLPSLPPPCLDYSLSDYSDPEREFHFSPVTTTSSTNCFTAFANEEEETKQKQCDKNDQIIAEAHTKLGKMKVAFPDSNEDVDDGAKIILLTTLIDDDNDNDDDDDGDNLDKKPPARLTVMEQTDLLEEKRKKYKEMVMEIEDSDSKASDVGMTEAQKAACCKYLNGLKELELTQNKPAKKKPAMSCDSTPPQIGLTGNSMVTPLLALTTSSVSTSTSTLTLVFTTPSFTEVAAKIPMTLHPLFSENKNTTSQKQQKTYIYGKFKISIPPMDQSTATIHGKLIKISTLLQEIDPTFVYCHYDPDKNLTVCYTLSDKDIPSRISELQIFHPTPKPNPTQNDIWAQAQISFNQDRATFLQDMGGSLMGIKSVFL